MLTIQLPEAGGRLESFTLRPAAPYRRPAGEFRCRTAYAAAHVVADPSSGCLPQSIGRRHSRSGATFGAHGFGVAEAMDTAQRGMGLDWTAAKRADRQISPAGGGSVGGLIRMRRRGQTHLLRTLPVTVRTSSGSVSGAGRVRRGRRWPVDHNGWLGSRALRAARGRLRVGVRPNFVTSPRAGDFPLVG